MTCPNPAGNTHHNFTEIPLSPETKELIKCLSDFPHVGIAILDSHFRYLSLNRALASMNGTPVDFHVGKTIREILGPAAQQLEPRLENVFATGKTTRFEFTARLLKRNEIGRWDVLYFPVGKPHKFDVCAVVRELTDSSAFRMSLYGLNSKLKALRAIINRENLDCSDSQDVNTRRALDLLNRCISEIVAVSKMSHPAIQQITHEILSAHESPVQSIDSSKPGSLQACLTKRELEVVHLLSEGKSNKEVALALGISVKTAEHHRTNAMYKLNAHSLVDLLRFASRHELIKLG